MMMMTTTTKKREQQLARPEGKGTAGAKVKTQVTGNTLGKELSLGP